MSTIAGRCFLVTAQNGPYNSSQSVCKEESDKLGGKWDGRLANENEQGGINVKALFDVFKSCMPITHI